MSTNEKDEFENKVADGSDAMDVDSVNVGEKLPLGQEEDRADDSEKMEVGEERPPVSHDENEDFDAKKEEGKNLVEIETGDGENHGENDDLDAKKECKNSVEIETGDGENHGENEDLDTKKEACKNSVEIEMGDGKNHDVNNNNSVGHDGGEAEADCLVDGVSTHILEEKGSDEVPLPNESKKGESQSLESQREGSVLAEERDENLEESSNAGKRMEDLSQDVSKKDETLEKLNDGAGGSIASVQNETKKEDELTSMNGSKEDELKREVEIAKVEEPKKELSKRELMDASLVVYDKTVREPASHVKEKLRKPDFDRAAETDVRTPPLVRSFLGNPDVDGYESGTEEEQREFSREIYVFHKERGIDFKPPKFYQEQLNILKLWRWVIKLGGYEQVTSCKLWRDVGESFRPPKTCTTVSWTFRGFYEKTLLEYEKQKILSGELPEIDSSSTNSMVPGTQGAVGQPSGSGRARRDAASRAMQGWHALRVSGNGEVGDPIIKEKHSTSLGKHERQLKNIALTKRLKQSPIEHSARVGHLKSPKPQPETMVVDAGPPAEWVKINVHRTKDCYEVYALVPGLLREEVRVQSDPAGRLVISGQPEHLDNPWGVTPFKKVVSLPTRIDPHQTSAVVTLHGQLFVRVPFEQSDN